MRLFEEKENKVIVNPELKLIPEFKAIAEKKEGVRLFGYLYFMYDFKSPYSKYSEEERHLRVAKDLAFAPEWKPDKQVIAAKNKYLELTDTPAIKTLRSIRDGLIASGNAIDMITNSINNAVNDSGEDAVSIEDTVKLVTSLFGIADKLPKVVESISALEDKIKKEQTADTKLRGGGSKGIFED